MKYFYSSIIISALLLSLCVFNADTIDTKTDDNVPFGLYLFPFQDNDVTEGRHRDATDYRNAWKTEVKTSSEGKGTYSTYWLENIYSVNVSPSHNVKQGSGAHYFATNDSGTLASNITVHMAVQNNNWGPTRYKVTGYWDEETQKKPIG